MKMIKSKEGGRIPFAYVFAIIFVLMLMLAGIYASILGYHNINSVQKFYEEADDHLRNIHDMVREKAYHTVMEVIHNITKKRDPKLYMIQDYVFQNFSRFINDTFPLITQDYNITVGNFSIKVVMDYKKTRDFIKNFRLTWVNFDNMLDNRVEGYRNDTMLPVYPYVVGFVNYTYHDKRTGYDIQRMMRFNRIIYSPLPLLKFAFDEFNSSTTNMGDFGRLMRYILTTVAQYRILLGYAAGAYDGVEIPVTEVLTKQDVEKAVNLALMLQSIRFFHTYDQQAASAMGITGILDRYARTGTIDAADIYFLWNSVDSDVAVGRIIGQAMYSYADRFVYELFRLFWGDNLAEEYFADPTLKEPFLSWDEIKNKGEDWAKQMLYIYLDKWRQWLQIPTTIFPHMDTADISVDFNIVLIWFGTPPVVITVPATAQMEWTIYNDPVSDTIDLILDPGQKREYFTLHAIGISESTDIPLYFYHTYQYDVVKKSFVDQHENYADGGPYYNTLKFVIDALTRSMKRRSDTYDDITNKGFVDVAAYDVAQLAGDSSAPISTDPKDQNTILVDGSNSIIHGPLESGVSTFESSIYWLKEYWWLEGAYKKYKNSTDDDAYLFYLTRDTVDLWYEAMKNLYDGGDPSPNDDAGPYDDDCESYPPDYQQSTWPRGYDGYPFNGRVHNGSFNFHRDLTRDAYNDIKAIIWEMTLEEWQKSGADLAFPDYDSETVWEEVKNQTEDARQNVVGKNGLIQDLNFNFPYFYFNPINYDSQNFNNLRSFLDYITDTGTYDGNFCPFVRWHVGERILGGPGYGACDENSTQGGGNNTNNTNNTNLTNGSFGVDVSHYQGTIDWTQVYNAGYTFAFVKASESTSYVDPLFAQNVNSATAAGLAVGAYHFARPTSNDPISEADHFVDTIRPYMSSLSLPPALDLEVGSSMGWSSLSNWAKQFLQRVQSRLGVAPIIYTSSYYARNLDPSLTQWGLWIAHWTYDPNATPNTGVWSDWQFWQYSDRGSVPGISGSVDLDKYHGSLKALKARMWAYRAPGDNLLDNMTEWMYTSLDVLSKNIVLSTNYSSLPIFLSMRQGKYDFWDSNYTYDQQSLRTKNETIVVDFDPDYLSNLNIMVGVGSGHRFVDVQDVDYHMGNAPYQYQIDVSVSGQLNMNLRTDRTSLVYGGKHWYTWYNDTVNINLHIKIPIYTVWFLESHWNKCTHQDNWAFHTDVPFSYTRGYFGMDTRDTKFKPFFVSRELNTFIYDYEQIGEIWNRYSTFYHFAMVNAKDEMAAWNYTYNRIILNATRSTNNALNNSVSMFSTVSNDLNMLFTRANGYTNSLRFFYFERTFTATRSNVYEDNGYQNYTADIGNVRVQEKYHEGSVNFTGDLKRDGFQINLQEIYDGINIHMSIVPGGINYYRASYRLNYQKRIPSLKMFVEAKYDVYTIDFGFVGDSNAVTSLASYIPPVTPGIVTQEDLIRMFHEMLKQVYIHYNDNIGYRLGIYVEIGYKNENNETYVAWYNGTPTRDAFIIWLNNEVRYIVYKVGISEFPQHAYDDLRLDSVYYMVNNLWMHTNYESSSIFGYRASGDFRGSWLAYTLNGQYSIDVPTPDRGHGDTS